MKKMIAAVALFAFLAVPAAYVVADNAGVINTELADGGDKDKRKKKEKAENEEAAAKPACCANKQAATKSCCANKAASTQSCSPQQTKQCNKSQSSCHGKKEEL